MSFKNENDSINHSHESSTPQILKGDKSLAGFHGKCEITKTPYVRRSTYVRWKIPIREPPILFTAHGINRLLIYVIDFGSPHPITTKLLFRCKNLFNSENWNIVSSPVCFGNNGSWGPLFTHPPRNSSAGCWLGDNGFVCSISVSKPTIW